MTKILFLLALLFVGALPAHAARWADGELVSGRFIWSNGGADPYRGTLDHALQLAGVDDAKLRNILVAEVAAHPKGNAPRYTIQDGDELGIMISGKTGWVARDTVARVSTWQSGRSKQVSVWYVVDPKTGIQYRLMRADVCGNWLIVSYGPPLRCRCNGRDAC